MAFTSYYTGYFFWPVSRSKGDYLPERSKSVKPVSIKRFCVIILMGVVLLF